MGEWRDVVLDDIADIIPGYAFKSQHFSGSGDMPVIKITDISPPFINIENAMQVDLSSYDKIRLEKYVIEKGDFVIAMTGATIGKIGRLNKDARALLNQRVAKISPKFGVDPDFVYYSIQGNEFQNFIQNNIDSNSAQENINGSSIGRYPIDLPPLAEQRAIASILSSLDNKIDLLRRENKTLEAMAESLFRQWFVVEANEDTSKLGEFALNIRENITVGRFSAFKHYIGLEHISKKTLALTDWGSPEDLASNKSQFKTNDILFGKLRPYFHKVCIAPFNGVCSTDILVIRPKKIEWYAFCIFWLFNEDLISYSDFSSGGTRMPRTDWQALADYAIPRPDLNKVADFNGICMPWLSKMNQNTIQMGTLGEIRGTLLPKVMAGEVRMEVGK